MKLLPFNFRSLLALFLFAGALVVVSGCATNRQESEVSERPWNNTQGWQGGLPSSLNEGR